MLRPCILITVASAFILIGCATANLPENASYIDGADKNGGAADQVGFRPAVHISSATNGASSATNGAMVVANNKHDQTYARSAKVQHTSVQSASALAGTRPTDKASGHDLLGYKQAMAKPAVKPRRSPIRNSTRNSTLAALSNASLRSSANVEQISLTPGERRLVQGLKPSGERLMRYQTPRVSLFNDRGDYVRGVKVSNLPMIPRQGIPVYNLGRNGLKVVVLSGRRFVLDPVELGISSNHRFN